MDTEQLLVEIADLETLLASAKDRHDAETQWACYLLHHCIAMRWQALAKVSAGRTKMLIAS